MMGLMPDDETQYRTRTLSPAITADAPTKTPTPQASQAPQTAQAAAGPSPWLLRLVTIGLVLTALNLRPAITSLGALLEEVQDGLHMSAAVAGVLTSVPPLCFAIFGIMAPRLARRFGPGAVVCAGDDRHHGRSRDPAPRRLDVASSPRAPSRSWASPSATS